MRETASLKRTLYILACLTFAFLLFSYHIKIEPEWNPDRRLITLYHRGDMPIGLVSTGNELFHIRQIRINQAWMFGVLVPVSLLFAAAYHSICLLEVVRKKE